MSVIFKFRLKIQDTQTLELPADAQMLSAQFQGTDLMLWALVSPEHYSRRDFTIQILATGESVAAGSLGRYIATAQDPRSGEVWHVFVGGP